MLQPYSAAQRTKIDTSITHQYKLKKGINRYWKSSTHLHSTSHTPCRSCNYHNTHMPCCSMLQRVAVCAHADATWWRRYYCMHEFSCILAADTLFTWYDTVATTQHTTQCTCNSLQTINCIYIYVYTYKYICTYKYTCTYYIHTYI